MGLIEEMHGMLKEAVPTMIYLMKRAYLGDRRIGLDAIEVLTEHGE